MSPRSLREHSSWRIAVLALFVGAGACSGTIDDASPLDALPLSDALAGADAPSETPEPTDSGPADTLADSNDAQRQDSGPVAPDGAASDGTAPEPWVVPPAGPADPSRVVLHRLNRTEFQNSVHAILAGNLEIRHLLPEDGVADEGDGFDNDAAAQTFSLLHTESYERALDVLITDALRPPVTVETVRLEAEAPAFSGSGDNTCGMDTYPFTECLELWFDAAASMPFTIEHAGPYTVRVRTCQAYGTENPVLAFTVDNVVQAQWTVTAPCNAPEIVEVELPLQAGTQEVGLVQLGLDGAKMVAFDYLELEGPLDADGATPPGRAKLYTCDPEATPAAGSICVRSIVDNVMNEAWRRPILPAEVDTVMALYETAVAGGSDVHHGIHVALMRVFLSPHFFFRVETPAGPDTDEVTPLSAHELAARLSYFLWSSTPDEGLRDAADDGSLLDDEVLEAQARRLFADPRADALVEGMGAQWFGLRRLAQVTPAPSTFPDFDDALRLAMDQEVRALVIDVLRNNRSMLEVLTAQERWVEPPLDAHYGLTLPTSEGAWVDVPGRSGAGVLTMAGWLTGTSNPTRTSPVRRGKWILTYLMCAKPPDPPPGVETELVDTGEAGTLAEQMKAHLADPSCASCHSQLDPLGLALESFDGVGGYRSTYLDGTAVETAGYLPGVGAFETAQDLAQKLATQKQVKRCLVQKTLEYALGRKPLPHDWTYYPALEAQFDAGGMTFEALMVSVVRSGLFRQHRGELPGEFNDGSEP